MAGCIERAAVEDQFKISAAILHIAFARSSPADRTY
jgi:hypothetical protein